MADRIIKPDTNNDLVLQNDDASAAVEINDDGKINITSTGIVGDIDLTGDLDVTGEVTISADLKVSGNDIKDSGNNSALTFDGSGNTSFNDKNISNVGDISLDTISEDASGEGVAIDGLKVKDSALVTSSNKYAYIKNAELNSIGLLNYNFFGATYYLSGGKPCTYNDYTEIDETWTKMVGSGSAGSDDADPFGKFASGRWTPTISGYYFVAWSGSMTSLDDGEVVEIRIRRNGSSTSGHMTACSLGVSGSSGQTVQVSGSGIMGLDTDDYLSMWVYHNEDSSGTQDLQANGVTTISFAYLGTSDL